MTTESTGETNIIQPVIHETIVQTDQTQTQEQQAGNPNAPSRSRHGNHTTLPRSRHGMHS